MSDKKIAFVAGKSESAQDAMSRLCGLYDHVRPDKADIIIALGGDGFMLRTLHKYLHLKKPVFGMNRGSVGFLIRPSTDRTSGVTSTPSNSTSAKLFKFTGL